jgi:hypothetical protein
LSANFIQFFLQDYIFFSNDPTRNPYLPMLANFLISWIFREFIPIHSFLLVENGLHVADYLLFLGCCVTRRRRPDRLPPNCLVLRKEKFKRVFRDRSKIDKMSSSKNVTHKASTWKILANVQRREIYMYCLYCTVYIYVRYVLYMQRPVTVLQHKLLFFGSLPAENLLPFFLR